MSKEIAPHFSASDVSNVKKFSRRKKVLIFNLTFVLPPQNFHLAIIPSQRAKKVVSDSPGLVEFAIGLVNSVFNLPDGQVIFF